MGKRITFRIGLTLLVLANAWDCICTSWGLTHNISSEFNPILQMAYSRYGIWGLLISKILIVGCVVVLVSAGYRYSKLRANKYLRVFTLIAFVGALAFFLAGLSWFLI